MKNEIYYTNLLNDRKATLWLLAHKGEYKTIRAHSGRKLNRLSTKQLVAKVRRADANYSKAVHNYVNYIDSFESPSVLDKINRVKNANTSELLTMSVARNGWAQ